MLGAIIGDILGSVYERHPTKDPACWLLNEEARPTDDTVLSVAVASAILEAGGKPAVADYAAALRLFGRRYPDTSYGGSFHQELKADNGVKAATSDTMFVLTGFRGQYEHRAAAYLPPPGVANWEQLVRQQGLRQQAGGRQLVYDPERPGLTSSGSY
ncbi:MAG: hypothetical protein KKI09_11410 [Spirochaetes bacterium]|nr:hypothetical protein [Spirochaetota bacterium]